MLRHGFWQANHIEIEETTKLYLNISWVGQYAEKTEYTQKAGAMMLRSFVI